MCDFQRFLDAATERAEFSHSKYARLSPKYALLSPQGLEGLITSRSKLEGLVTCWCLTQGIDV